MADLLYPECRLARAGWPGAFDALLGFRGVHEGEMTSQLFGSPFLSGRVGSLAEESAEEALWCCQRNLFGEGGGHEPEPVIDSGINFVESLCCLTVRSSDASSGRSSRSRPEAPSLVLLGSSRS